MKDLHFSLLIDFYGNLLAPKMKDALELYYNEDLSLSEIAQHMQITRQGVRDNIKRGEQFLAETEARLGFFKRYSGLEDQMEQISNLAMNIRDFNIRHHNTPELNQFAEEIISIAANFKEQE
ncbi:MAG: DNA-binding protein [Clostridia bacterium]|nr:DNA-binding protein [Clostridia bacterium]